MSQWLVIWLISRLLGVEQLADYSLALAYTAPVFMFAQFNLATYLATDVQGEFALRTYLRFRVLCSALAFLGVALFVVLFSQSGSAVWVVVLVALSKTFDGLSDLCYGALQREGRMTIVARSLLMKAVLAAFSIFVSIHLFDDYLPGLVLLCLVWCLIAVFHDLAVLRARYDFGQHKEALYKLLRRCWPLGFVMMLATLNVNLPIYFLDLLGTKQQVGIYAAIAYFFLLSKVVCTPVMQAIAPRIARLRAQNDMQNLKRFCWKVVSAFVSLSALLMLLSLLVGKDCLRLVYGEVYAQEQLLLWIVLAMGINFLSQFLATCLTISRSFKAMLLVQGVAALVAAFTAYQLVPVLGTTGAGIALVACVTSLLLGNLLRVDKTFFGVRGVNARASV